MEITPRPNVRLGGNCDGSRAMTNTIGRMTDGLSSKVLAGAPPHATLPPSLTLGWGVISVYPCDEEYPFLHAQPPRPPRPTRPARTHLQ